MLLRELVSCVFISKGYGTKLQHQMHRRKSESLTLISRVYYCISMNVITGG